MPGQAKRPAIRMDRVHRSLGVKGLTRTWHCEKLLRWEHDVEVMVSCDSTASFYGDIWIPGKHLKSPTAGTDKHWRAPNQAAGAHDAPIPETARQLNRPAVIAVGGGRPRFIA